MGRLHYVALMSLDGYVADPDGNFHWAAPDAQVHAFVNGLERGIGTHLYGRRMYEVMRAWEDMPLDDEPGEMRDYASIWRAADKVVYSSTLERASSERTSIERAFDPDDVRRRKSSSDADLSIGGPTVAAEALAANLVDECHFFVTPVSVGGGTAALPSGQQLELRLLDEHRFDNGVVYLRYAVEHSSSTGS